MSHTFRDGEQDRPKQVKFRAREELVEEFDATIDGSRSEALRQFMEDVVGSVGELDVPDNRELADAYRWLVRHRNRDDLVSVRRARKGLAEVTGYTRDDVRRYLLVPLARRGYIGFLDVPPGEIGDGAIRVRVLRRET